MNEEIKEILRYLEECVANDNRFLIGNTNATKLSYYITNLQEENKKLKEANEEHLKINGGLRKENQKLVKVIDELEKYMISEKERMLGEIGMHIRIEIDYILNKLTELKGGSDE